MSTKLAIFTAGLHADNAGDSIIESAVIRLLEDVEVHRFPLTVPLTEEQIEQINACDTSVICGTNLYQETFAANLTEEVVNRIRIPITPFGIGASAAMGRIPEMDAAGVAAVRAIHRKCAVGSVRDEASYRFIRSLGIANVRLTGCPVLFHGLGCPDFNPSGEGYTLTPRARLLHIDPKWQDRQLETLDVLARRYRPKMVLQSPYDLEIAESLAAKYGLEILMERDWQSAPYIEAARAQSINMGFRLHLAMLSLSYGKPAYLVSHDSRAAEFCRLVGLPIIPIDGYSDNFLQLLIDSRDFPADTVRRRWNELAGEMADFIQANGLRTALVREARPTSARVETPPRRKPRICILADQPGWAYDHSMQQVRKRLAGEFDITIDYVSKKPKLDARRFDLLHVCFWGEKYHQQFGFDPSAVMKELSSHRWQFDAPHGPIDASQLGNDHLADCDTVLCTSLRLKELVSRLPHHAYHTPNGVEVERFRPPAAPRDGPLVFGWAGNSSDPLKGFHDIVEPASEGRKLLKAQGELRHAQMPAFYASVDVYLVASRHEGEPLTLLEAMAAGCFPICTDVGIVPELVRHQENGYVLPERTIEAMREAMGWCEANAGLVRAAGARNARLIARERNWYVCAQYFARAYKETLARVERPKFRNDDVSWDSSLENLRKFSAVFHKHGQVQIHGVTLNGRTNTKFRKGEVATEYEGEDTVSRLSNARIRELSAGADIRERTDLITWLNESPDELALHGLFHTDYSQMSLEEQDRDIGEGLRRMRELFPKKRIRYFIAPFNRTNPQTYTAAARHGLKVVAEEGVHLEADLDNLEVRPGEWYRYHHHRFYPDSTFDFWKLSIEKLEASLERCFAGQPPYLGLRLPPPGPRVGARATFDRFRDSAVGRALRRVKRRLFGPQR